MITFLFDVLIIVIISCLFLKIEYGAILVLLGKIVIPYYVRFKLGPISIAYTDIVLFSIFLSFVIKYSTIKQFIPGWFRKFTQLSIISSLFVVFFSSAIVPYEFQLRSLMINIVEIFMFLFIFCYSIKVVNQTRFFNLLFIVSLLSGIYGIIASLLNVNPYITFTSYNYTGADSIFSFFLEDARGGLEGRTSGTMTHPLSWGEFWVLVVNSYWLFKKYINRYLGYSTVVVGLLNIYMCGSRSALLAITISMVIIFIFNIRKHTTKYLTFACLFAVFFTISNYSLSFRSNRSDFISYVNSTIFFFNESDNSTIQGGSSTQMRQTQISSALDFISSNPVFGVGLDYQYYVLQNKRSYNSDLYGFESIIIKKIVEEGFWGLIIYVFLMFYLFKSVWKKIKYSKNIVSYLSFFVAYNVVVIATGVQGACYLLFLLFSITHFILSSRFKRYDTQNNTLVLVKQ